MKIPMEEAVDRACRDIIRGTRTLPQALRDLWHTARQEERLDGLRMEQAQRDAKALRRRAPQGEEGSER